MITILNYDKYQAKQDGDRQAKRQASDRPATGDRQASDNDRTREQGNNETMEQKKAPKRACQIPESWQPNDRGLALAAELGIDAAEEAESFRDYWLGEGKTKKDWDATFRNRLKAAAKRMAERQGKQAFLPELEEL